MRKYILSVSLTILGGFAGAALYHWAFPTAPETSNLDGYQANSPLKQVMYTGPASPPVDFTAPAERAVTSVVHVKTTVTQTGGMTNPFFDPFSFFWGQPAPQAAPRQQSAGSGVILSEDGYIVTNNHVIENADEVSVTLDDKHTYKARVVGIDPSTDLALLKVEAEKLPYIKWGNSDQVRVGEWVLAVGNPFNLTSTVTAGIVSAKARNINILPNQRFPIESFIQTDAAVNPGNSGGALVNSEGELVGINTAIASNTGSYAGYSFAIPVNMVRKVVDDLIEFGTVQRGFIGVSIRDVDAEFAKEKELRTLQGVYVNGLTEGGAAENAGIKEGDVIVAINGAAVKSSPELQEQVGRHRPGDRIQVSVIRKGEEKLFAVTLRNKEGTTSVKRNETASLLGATLENASEVDLGKLSINAGVKVKELRSGKLKNAGLKDGFIITAIDNKPVHSPSEVISYLENKQGGVLIEGIYPNGMKAFYGFGM